MSTDTDRRARRTRLLRLRELRRRVDAEIAAVEKADQRDKTTRVRGSGEPPLSMAETSIIRDWARRSGIPVPQRGRISDDLRAQHYVATHPRERL